MGQINYESALSAAGKFGPYQIFLLLFYQSVVMVTFTNITFMLFGGIFPKCPTVDEAINTTSQFETLDHENSTITLNTTLCNEKFWSVVMEWNLTGHLKYLAALMTSLQGLSILIS